MFSTLALTPYQLASPSTPLSTAATADADVGDGAVVMSKTVLADCAKEMDAAPSRVSTACFAPICFSSRLTAGF
jgi:hypothetical protein